MTQQRISPCVTVGPEITQVPQWATVQDHYSDKGLAQRLTCRMDDEQRPRKGMTNDKLVYQWQLEGFFFFSLRVRPLGCTTQVKCGYWSRIMDQCGYLAIKVAMLLHDLRVNTWETVKFPRISLWGGSLWSLCWAEILRHSSRPAATVTETKTKTRAHGPMGHSQVSRHKSSSSNAPSGTITFLRGSPWDALGQGVRACQRFEWMELFPQKDKKKGWAGVKKCGSPSGLWSLLRSWRSKRMLVTSSYFFFVCPCFFFFLILSMQAGGRVKSCQLASTFARAAS